MVTSPVPPSAMVNLPERYVTQTEATLLKRANQQQAVIRIVLRAGDGGRSRSRLVMLSLAANSVAEPAR